MVINYRPASINELDKIYTLNSKLAEYESQFNKNITNKIPKEEFMKTYSKKIISEKSTFFIAEDKDEIIGYIFGWIELSSYVFNYKDKGIIAECFVKENYRKQGIGKKLVNNMLNWFKEQNIDWIKVDVIAKNNAQEFWHKIGFKDFSISMVLEK